MLNAIWAAMILLSVVYGAATGHMSDVTNAALDSAGEAISLCITMAGVVALWMGLMEIAQKAGLVRKLTKGISPFLRFLFPRIPAGHPAGEYIATNVIANILGLGWACTPAGLKAMEELAKLEAERGNPEYLEEEIGGRDVRGERGSREQQYVQESSMGKGASRAAERELRRRPGGQRSPAGGFAKTEIASKENLPHQGNDNRGRRASNEMCIFLILNISSLQLIPVNMIAYRSQYGSANPTAIIAPAIAATLVSTLVAIVYCKIKDHSARSGMGRSRMGGNGMGQNHKGSRADLTASEIRRISGSGVGSLRPDTDVRMLWGRRKDKGGKAV